MKPFLRSAISVKFPSLKRIQLNTEAGATRCVFCAGGEDTLVRAEELRAHRHAFYISYKIVHTYCSYECCPNMVNIFETVAHNTGLAKSGLKIIKVWHKIYRTQTNVNTHVDKRYQYLIHSPLAGSISYPNTV